MSSIAAVHWENIPEGPVAAAAGHVRRTAVYFTGDMSKVVSSMIRCGVAWRGGRLVVRVVFADDLDAAVYTCGEYNEKLITSETRLRIMNVDPSPCLIISTLQQL